jgi:hypothetical protein
MQTDAEVAAIARQMNKRIRTAVGRLSAEWHAGPDLPAAVLDVLRYLRSIGVVERQFGDQCQPEYLAAPYGLSVKLRACWYFRLTPLGLRVAQHLKQENSNVR